MMNPPFYIWAPQFIELAYYHRSRSGGSVSMNRTTAFDLSIPSLSIALSASSFESPDANTSPFASATHLSG